MYLDRGWKESLYPLLYCSFIIFDLSFFLRWKKLILLIPPDITKSTMLLLEYGNVSILIVNFLYSEPYSSCFVLLGSLQSFTSPLLSVFWVLRTPWYCPPVLQLILYFISNLNECVKLVAVSLHIGISLRSAPCCYGFCSQLRWPHHCFWLRTWCDSEAGKYFKVVSSHLCALHIGKKTKGQITHSKF